MQKQDIEYISRIKPHYIPFIEAIAKFADEKSPDEDLTMDNIEEVYWNITTQRNLKSKSRTTLYRYASNLDEKYDLIVRKDMENDRGKLLVPKFHTGPFLEKVNEYYEDNS